MDNELFELIQDAVADMAAGEGMSEDEIIQRLNEMYGEVNATQAVERMKAEGSWT